MVENVATALRESGVRPGIVCAMICPISLESMVYFLALMWIGAIAAPIDPGLEWENMREYLKEMGAFCVVSPLVDDDDKKVDVLWGKVEKAAGDLGLLNWHVYRTTNEGVLVDMHGTRADKSAAWSGGAGDFKIDPAEIAVRIAGSGDGSGDKMPKILAFSHANLAAAAMSFSETYHLVSEMTTVMTSALHTMEGISVLISTLFSGGHLVIPGPTEIDVDTFLQIAKPHKVKWISCSPQFTKDLAQAVESNESAAKDVNLTFIRCCGKNGSETSAEGTIRDKMGTPVLSAYGFVGSANLVTGNKPDMYRHGTMGKAIARCDVAIFDSDTREIVEREKEGEIGVAGLLVSDGFINDSALNESSIVVVENEGGESAKYFLTGDLGVLDADGYLKVYGTAKEMKARKLAEMEEEEIRNKEAAALLLQKETAERQARELDEQKRRKEEEQLAAEREAAEREIAEKEAAEQQAQEAQAAEERARREAEAAAAAALASTRDIEPGNVSERDVALLKETARNEYLDPETARLILERLAAIEANQKKFQEEVERRHQQELADLQARLDEAQRRLQEKEAMSLALQEAVESANRSNQSAKDAADAAREVANALAAGRQNGEEQTVVEVADPNCVTRTVKVSLDDMEDGMKMHPSIAEARGFGRPDSRTGYEVFCAIKPKTGARVSEAWLKLHAQSVLPAAFVPKKFFLVNDLQRDTDRWELAKNESLEPILAKRTNGKSRAKLVKPPAWKPTSSNSYASSNIST